MMKVVVVGQAALIVALLVPNYASGTETLNRTKCVEDTSSKTIYDFSVEDFEGNDISLREYEGKVVMVVNVATFCEYTLQYPGMNELQSKYDGDLAIIAFPCNQFLHQEPGVNGKEILNCIKHVRPGNGFEPNFKLFQKLQVNGQDECPLFTYLKSLCPPTRETFAATTKLFYQPLSSNDIRWNWEKFLIDRRGKPCKRYDPSVTPQEIEKDVDSLVKLNKI